jgi:hypothetical protein
MFQPAAGGVEATTLDDIEWMLSKAAGFDSGFALVSSPAEFAANGQGEAAIAAIREWEAARHAHAFTAGQKARLRDGRTDWHLEPAGPGRWRLRPITFTPALECDGPMPAAREVQNPYAAQPLRFVLRVASADGEVADPSVEVGGQRLAIPVRLKAGQYLGWEGDGNAHVYDANWHVLQTADLGAGPRLASGPNQVRVTFTAGGATKTSLRVRMTGKAEAVGRGPAARG